MKKRTSTEELPKRTVRDFVRELCKAGKNDEHVKLIARNTRWRDHIEEVLYWLRRRGDRWRSRKIAAPEIRQDPI